MYGSELGCHETCRLPMFYMAAYAVTQEQHWIDAYRATRDWCLEKAEEVKIESYFQGAYSGTFALLQMQISLRLLYDYEEDIAYKERYKILMHRVANGIYGATFEAKEKLKDFAMPHTLPAWRNVPQKFIREEQWSIVGRKVIMRDVYTAAGVNLQALRNVSENIITQCICPDFEIKQEQIDAFTSVVEKISFESPCCFVPTGYCLAWWSLKTR